MPLRGILFEDLLLVEFMYPAFIRISGESYRGRLKSLLCFFLCDIFRALINLLVVDLSNAYFRRVSAFYGPC